MMTTRRIVLGVVGSGIACLLLAGMGQAQAPRVFVSINGSDANPCSAVQPCRSFNQALTAVEAGGEIVVQSSGGYSTGFTITQGVTIDSAGYNASVISTTATDLCTINTTGTVVLRGISFHGAQGLGKSAITVTQVGSLYVEHCSIAEFSLEGVLIPNGGNLIVTGTDVRKCLNGIFLTSGAIAANLVAHDSRFTECPGHGVILSANGTGAASGSMSNCTASLCGGEGFVALSGAAAVTLALTNCQAFNNSTGFSANSLFSGDANMLLTNCQAVGNGTGISVAASSTGNTTIRIANCLVTQNNVGLAASQTGTGLPKVIGTSPGSNVIADNTSGNGTGNAPLVLQ